MIVDLFELRQFKYSKFDIIAKYLFIEKSICINKIFFKKLEILMIVYLFELLQFKYF